MNLNQFTRERIIVFAPDGPNLKVIKNVLTKAGLACCTCDAVDEFCRLLDEGAGVGIILNEILTRDNAACIRRFLQDQPPWADLAIILFTRDMSMQIPYLELFGSHHNITTLELPIHTSALVGLLQSLLRARRRQYDSEDLINELHRTREKLLKYKTDLEKTNRELETIIGIVSHDLRAPLVNVKGFSNEIAKDIQTLHTLLSGLPFEDKIKKHTEMTLHESIPESLRFIQSSAEAMNSLVVTLVEVARAGLIEVKPAKLNMNKLLREITESIRIKFKAAKASFDFGEIPDCFADRTQVSQIFRNLLDNAVKYLDKNRPGQICIGGKLQADGALYWVADNGIGISPEDQEKIFEPYYQIKEKAAGGVGLGLVTVKRMVDRNGGKIWVVSERGKYSTFYVALPKA